MTDLKHTPLHALHTQLGAKMVPFAGYDMPVQYRWVLKKSMSIPASGVACSMCRIWDRFWSPEKRSLKRWKV